MSTTMTLTMSRDTVAACPNCGIGLPDRSGTAIDTQKQIDDLQAQVRLLTQKATNADDGLKKDTVDKWADYEDEIHELKAQHARSSAEAARAEAASPNRSSYLPVQNRLSSFLTRKSTPNLKNPAPPNIPSASDLAAALTREQALRQAADKKLDESSAELEELSTQLFMQANEMVATERKARAKLEERVALLESRDGEKRKRLERLEGAVARIERVRGLLAPGP
ncbi:ribosomal protein L32 [Diplocarpon rosae]|nr:ribosomal protein L32 [Diplocarpon rosae]